MITLTEERLFAKAIADDTRYAIMTHLCCVWLSVGEVVEKLGGKVNQPTVSHHLKVLEEAKLVNIRQEGRQRFYTLNRHQVVLCCGTLQRLLAPEDGGGMIPLQSILIEEAETNAKAPTTPGVG
ncbi:MAG: metalloregulator ArsR/SmtB family transcription factor [Chloroflexota bacterium]|nr:metalloregulator ArsR/SmtB family transcription factor [Chloroflexota bacterium]